MAYKRASVVAFIVAFCGLIGVPTWNALTSITRPQFEPGTQDWLEGARKSILSLPTNFQVHVIDVRGAGTVYTPDSQEFQSFQRLANLSDGHGDDLLTNSVKVAPIIASTETCNEVAHDLKVPGCAAFRALTHGGIQTRARHLPDVFDRSAGPESAHGGHYHIFIVLGHLPTRPGAAFITTGRSSWLSVTAESWAESTADTVRSIMTRMLNGSRVESENELLPISAASETTLSFTLCSADSLLPVTWDFAFWDQAVWQHARKRLQPLLDLHVDSRILLGTKARVQAVRTPGKGSIIQERDLPFFVDQDAWSLDFGRLSTGHGPDHGIPQHVLNIVAYVPEDEARPLYIAQADGARPADRIGFTAPMWGGVVIINDVDMSESAVEGTSDVQRSASITDGGMHLFTGTAIQQLRLLLGWSGGVDVDWHAEGGSVNAISAGEDFVSEWELDALIRDRWHRLTHDSIRVVLALLKLVAKLPNLSMPDAISDKVNEAKDHLASGFECQAAGDYAGAIHFAREARLCAEVAFSHHSIMAQHNYPDQHKVAVYMPMFLPLSVPIAQVLVSEVKQRVGKRL